MVFSFIDAFGGSDWFGNYFPSNFYTERYPYRNIDKISFAYAKDTKTVVDNLSLQIQAGQFIGIAGPSGCGKSSLIKLITKLEQNTTGKITINNHDLASMSRAEIADLMALVPQSPFLIAGTIKENICYGVRREISDAELQDVVRKACLNNLIAELPQGLNTVIAEGGRNLSGG